MTVGARPAYVKRADEKVARLEKQLKKVQQALDYARDDRYAAVMKWQRTRGVYARGRR